VYEVVETAPLAYTNSEDKGTEDAKKVNQLAILAPLCFDPVSRPCKGVS
jgi:hypothetical protein